MAPQAPRHGLAGRNILFTAALAAALSAAGPVHAQSTSADAPQRVVVFASRFASDASELPYGVSVLTAREIRDAGVTTVNEALVRLLGVPGRQDLSGGGEYALDLRGFGASASSNQIVVVDGVRLNEGDTSGVRLSGIPIDSVERIEVLRGGGTVLYGEGATGGVIVITTKPGHGGSPASSQQVHVAAGSDALREARAGATLVAGEVSLDLTAQRRQSDGHRHNFDSRTDGVSLAAHWQRPGWRVTAQHAWDALESGLPGALSATNYAVNPRAAKNPDDRGRIDSRRQSVQAEADVGGWTVSGETGRRVKASRTVLPSVFPGYAYDYDVDAGSWGLRARTDRTLAGWYHRLAVGVDGGRWRRDVLGAFGSTAEQSQHGIFLRDEVMLPAAVRASVGWRRERLSKADSMGSLGVDANRNAWEFGLLQTLAPGWQWHARIGDSFRYANADEYSFTAPGSTLRPQVSRDAELGLRGQQGERRWALRVWRSVINDEIGYDPGAVIPGRLFNGANVNFDPTRRQGLEAEGTQRLGPAVDLRGALAWRSATFRAGPYAGHQVPLVSAFTGSVGVQWRPASGHRVGATLVHASSAHPDLANACTMPSHTTLDLHYAWTFRSLEGRVGIGNATDRRHFTQAFACAAGQPDAVYPEPGRTVKASLRLAF